VKGHLYRLDFAWPDLRVALEFDGLMKYLGSMPTAEVLRQERERENALIDQGWVIVRIRWADLAHPLRIQAMLERAFERARRYRAA
jgi:very-short-patch-repair endonuclease